MAKESGQLLYIDGLKSICGMWIILFHYLLAFAGFGFVGFSCGVAEADKYDYFFQYFPYSIISNSSCALHLFFAIIAFLPAMHFFQNNNREWIQRQALIRYFRLMPPVLLIVVVTYIIFACNGFSNQELGALLGNTWDKFFYTENLSLAGAFYNGLYDTFWHGNADYVSVLWCAPILFFGSYIAYGILLFFGDFTRRYLVYIACSLPCLDLSFGRFPPYYLIFIGGIVAADLLKNGPKAMQMSEIQAFSLLVLGLVLMHIPTVSYAWPVLEYVAFAVGAACILIACARSRYVQRFLSCPFLVASGKYSFSMVLVHMPVMFTFSAWFFLSVYPHCGYELTLALTFITAIPANAIAVIVFQKCIAKPTSMLSKAVYSLVK